MSGEGGAIAEVLAAHESEQLWKAGGWAGDTACSCGWRMAMWTRKDFPEAHRKHVAEVLADLLAAERQRGREEVINAVRRLHNGGGGSIADGEWCMADGETLPCPTIRALADVPAAAEGERE